MIKALTTIGIIGTLLSDPVMDFFRAYPACFIGVALLGYGIWGMDNIKRMVQNRIA